MKRFDVIIIGKGLVGSATARYLSASRLTVAIIGPDEPLDKEKAIVFASHYDQSRIQRLIGRDAVWTRLNIDSASQYESIRHQTGIEFHEPVGCLYVNPAGKDGYLDNAKPISEQFNTSFRSFDSGKEISDQYPDFRFPESARGIFESSPAGLINPRLLIKAQLKILESNHGVIIHDTVVHISQIGTEFLVETSEGNNYFAHKIILAAGSFVNFFNLIPKKLELVLKSEVVLLARLSEQDAHQLSALPSLLYEIDNGEVEGVYLVKPLQYPDGYWHLKLGCNLPEDILLGNISTVQEWFRKGESDRFMPRLTATLMEIMPGLKPIDFQTKRCIISRSVHGRPYIGETSRPGCFVASGCNGYSAMCSDAIGKLAAHLIVYNMLPKGYDEKDFELAYQI